MDAPGRRQARDRRHGRREQRRCPTRLDAGDRAQTGGPDQDRGRVERGSVFMGDCLKVELGGGEDGIGRSHPPVANEEEWLLGSDRTRQMDRTFESLPLFPFPPLSIFFELPLEHVPAGTIDKGTL
jgi:hypothetical protein